MDVGRFSPFVISLQIFLLMTSTRPPFSVTSLYSIYRSRTCLAMMGIRLTGVPIQINIKQNKCSINHITGNGLERKRCCAFYRENKENCATLGHPQINIKTPKIMLWPLHPDLSVVGMLVRWGRRAGSLPALLNLAWKHISPVKAIWLDLEKGIHKQHKPKLLWTFDTDALILSTAYLHRSLRETWTEEVEGKQQGGRGLGWFPRPPESKSATCNSVNMKQEEGTRDWDNLLIHGQQWAGGGFRIGQCNEAHLEDCTE